MHPYQAAQLAEAHMADLRREALANCCANLVARISLRDRLTAATSRVTAAFARRARTGRATPACCPA